MSESCGRTTAASVVVMSVVVITITALIVPVLAMMTMLVLFVAALRTIAGLVLRGAHEIHRPVAGVVLVAVLAPVLRVTRRHVQIDRLHRRRLSHHHRHGHYRLHINDARWRPVTQHHLAIYARNDFAGDGRVDTHTLRVDQGHGRHQGHGQLQYETDRSHKHSSGLIDRTHGANYAKAQRE